MMLIISTAMLCSCGEPNGMYVDLTKGAIVTCTGHGMKHLEIESDSDNVKLEGTGSIIYFNKTNLIAKTTVTYDSVVYDYVLKLKPNTNYTATSRVGGDQGPYKISFKTDSLGNVISASNVSCND